MQVQAIKMNFVLKTIGRYLLKRTEDFVFIIKCNIIYLEVEQEMLKNPAKIVLLQVYDMDYRVGKA